MTHLIMAFTGTPCIARCEQKARDLIPSWIARASGVAAVRQDRMNAIRAPTVKDRSLPPAYTPSSAQT